MKSRILAPWLVLFACLSAAVTPALAREGVDPAAPDRHDASQQVKESTARYRQAKADYDRLTAEVTRLEKRLSGVEGQQSALRSLATRGAAALYMHDPTVDWFDGFGDGGEAFLIANRRAKLIGGINELASAAVRNLADSARAIDEDRQRLRDRRREQEAALAQLNGERRAAEGRLSALVLDDRRAAREAAAEQRRAAEEQRRADAAARAAERAGRAALRASRGAPTGRTPIPVPPNSPSRIVCPLNGPFKWGDGWGAGRGHKGVDMLAARGTENVAAVAGTFDTRFWGGGGLTLFLRGDDGNTYVYMHLLQIVGDQPRHVEAGEVIALTGASGNASAYHLHFEFHPGNEGAVDPYPLVLASCPPSPRDH